MAANDYDICNLALLKIGERQLLTSLTDGSTAALVCAALYPQVRDEILCRTQWRFSTRVELLELFNEGVTVPNWNIATIYAKGDLVIFTDGNYYSSRQGTNIGHAPVSGGAGDLWWEPGLGPKIIPGWAYVYQLPADFLAAQRIFNGARAGAPGIPLVNPNVFAVTQIDLIPGLSGQSMEVPFQVVGSYLFTDQQGAQLIYTAQVWNGTDVSMFPPQIVNVIAWRLAQELALALANNPALAAGMKPQVMEALAEAKAAEGNAEQADPRPDSRFIAKRA